MRDTGNVAMDSSLSEQQHFARIQYQQRGSLHIFGWSNHQSEHYAIDPLHYDEQDDEPYNSYNEEEDGYDLCTEEEEESSAEETSADEQIDVGSFDGQPQFQHNSPTITYAAITWTISSVRLLLVVVIMPL